MAVQGDWSRRQDWYLRWSGASNRERLGIIWHRRPLVVVAVGLLGVFGVAWSFWGHVTEFGSWLHAYSETIRNVALAVGVCTAIFGGWVAYQRSQTDRTRAGTDRLRQVTDSFARAVELLGHQERSVRLGAIYALERIARQNRDEHWPIMETLTAYVREWSARREREAGEAESDEGTAKGAGDIEPAPADIRAVLTVLGRRCLDHEPETSFRSRRLDLSCSYLVRVDLDPASELGKADLSDANLTHAGLAGVNLAGANLIGAMLAPAHLCEAKLTGVDLQQADLQGADLKAADLRQANLAEAKLAGAKLAGADLSDARGLTQPQLDAAIGDRETKIPEGGVEELTRPAHWLK